MLSYETLDAIADSYNPALFVACCASLIALLFKKKYKKTGQSALLLFETVFLAYFIVFIDRHFEIMESFDMDFSTHMAVSISLCVTLVAIHERYKYPIGLSLICYVLLMLYQQYHSLGELFVTTLVIAPIALLFQTRMLSGKKS